MKPSLTLSPKAAKGSPIVEGALISNIVQRPRGGAWRLIPPAVSEQIEIRVFFEARPVLISFFFAPEKLQIQPTTNHTAGRVSGGGAGASGIRSGLQATGGGWQGACVEEAARSSQIKLG
jgi:hypothetical protein